MESINYHCMNSFSPPHSITATDEKNYKTKHYSLEAIIAVGYRVNSELGTKFRIWATDKLKGYILKGFAVDSERFKHGTRFETRYFDELLEEIREIRASERMAYQKITDIYATSIDYSSHTAQAEKFFAVVQNKLHFAITGRTAAEIIASRADKNKPNMGLTSWRKSPEGKILPKDIRIAKNWSDKLDAFLKFNEQDILENAGKVSHDVAVALAEKEFENFRVEQDKRFESDFDRVVKKYLSENAKNVNKNKDGGIE